MKAVACTGYGPPEVLQLTEVAKPAPKANEVCIKIHATAVTASDCIVRGFKLPIWHPIGLMMGIVVGFKKPRQPILGMVFAGEVESIGGEVQEFKVGDAIYGSTGTRFGCYAEYTCVPEKRRFILPASVPSVMAAKPENMTYVEAAAVPYGSMMALHYLDNANIQPGQKVLIYGASGAIGTAAVQLAKHHLGAEVTGICSTQNLELVQSLGADHVIDYTQQDHLDDGARYDFVLDAVGKKKSSKLKEQCKKALTPDGKYTSVDSGSPEPRTEYLVLLKKLVEAGKFRAVIDQCYPLDQLVAAHHHVDAGHKKGNVIITMT